MLLMYRSNGYTAVIVMKCDLDKMHIHTGKICKCYMLIIHGSSVSKTELIYIHSNSSMYIM